MRIRQTFDIEFEVQPDGPFRNTHAECIAEFFGLLRIFQRRSIPEDGRQIMIRRFRAVGLPLNSDAWPEDG
jgi:hypothetical protein